MGKAFSEEERAEVKDKLQRTGLELFREKGIKGVSIRQLTAAAGIAQGGFYTFYKDKTDLIIDLIELRVTQKLSAMAENGGSSLDDPAGYLAGRIYDEGMHLKNNKAFDNSISGTLDLFRTIDKESLDRIKRHYRRYLEARIEYWCENGYTVDADVDGLLSVFRMALIMISNSALLDEEHFSVMYRAFCTSSVGEFLKVSRS